jgi:hypothetical protein
LLALRAPSQVKRRIHQLKQPARPFRTEPADHFFSVFEH